LSRASGTELQEIIILPAKHFMTPEDKAKVAMATIRQN